MKKYWIGMPFAKMALAMAAGYAIVEIAALCLLGSLFQPHVWLISLLLGNVLAAVTLTTPVGIWKVFWVKDGKVFEQHVLTRCIRSIPLDAQSHCSRRETMRLTWLVVTTGAVYAADVKRAKELYRQGQAMMIPVEGPLVEPLGEITAKAPCIE